MCSLQDILPRLSQPKKLPGALPLVHVSKSGKSGFKQIINDLKLSPQKCKVFKKDLLYFSYGDVFYDTGNKPTRDKDQLPITNYLLNFIMTCNHLHQNVTLTILVQYITLLEL